ncbi:MAG: glycosyltransferase [candidate division Zixibacteria bacterium]|nr:glycosyltransferase [candidate division Zixibacteria bacterium]MDH3936814.1 glycosyltransferase [candidate division Zixibacteria bacterium]
MTADNKYDFLVTTIVPAMNEEGNIEQFCRLFHEMDQAAPFDNELVIIDDGSTDGTLDKIKEAGRKFGFVRYESHGRNLGLTEALLTGFGLARGDVFVFYPADLQFLPEDIPKLVAKIADGADLCAGWKQGNYQKPFVSGVYNRLSRKLFGLKIHDLNSCKAFRREVVEEVFLRRDWHRYLVPLAADKGFRIEEAKVTLHERNWGASKFGSIWRIPIGVLDLLAVKFQITFLRKPLLFFGSIGSILVILGLVVGLVAIYLRLDGEGYRPLLYLVMLLVGIGSALFLMGFMAEGQVAVKDEMSDLRKKMMRLMRYDKPGGGTDNH